MISPAVTIVSLRPAADKPLELDLKHILHALRPFLSEWVWCIQKVDWLGDDSSEDVCRRVADAGASGLWISALPFLSAKPSECGVFSQLLMV
jgi:hypothetical protein